MQVEIIASSVQKAGDFFLHAGYVSAQGFRTVLVPGTIALAGLIVVLEFCKSKAWISDRMAKVIALLFVFFLFILAAAFTPHPHPGPD